jgi:hypothetical protein
MWPVRCDNDAIDYGWTSVAIVETFVGLCLVDDQYDLSGMSRRHNVKPGITIYY